MTIDQVKQTLINGKQMIANIVGGNYSSSFATLANNALTIKTQRDQYKSQLNSKYELISGHITSNTFKAQIQYPFKNQKLQVSIYGSYQCVYTFHDSGYLSRIDIDGDSSYHTSYGSNLVSGNEWIASDRYNYFQINIIPVNGKSYCEFELINRYSNNMVYYSLYR